MGSGVWVCGSVWVLVAVLVLVGRDVRLQVMVDGRRLWWMGMGSTVWA